MTTTFKKMETPWGTAQTEKEYAQGIVWVETASHGGFWVDTDAEASMPSYMRLGGWYEEDCDWSIVVTMWPHLFGEKERAAACKTLRNWHPEIYERFYGVTLQPEESFVKSEKVWQATHAEDWQVIAAWGSGRTITGPIEVVPEGFVVVIAAKGGRSQTPPFGWKNEKAFLLPAKVYEGRGRHGFAFGEGEYPEA